MAGEPHSWRPAIAFSAVALLLRLIPILLAADMGIALDDMFQYDALAQSIRLGQGFTWFGGHCTRPQPRRESAERRAEGRVPGRALKEAPPKGACRGVCPFLSRLPGLLGESRSCGLHSL